MSERNEVRMLLDMLFGVCIGAIVALVAIGKSGGCP